LDASNRQPIFSPVRTSIFTAEGAGAFQAPDASLQYKLALATGLLRMLSRCGSR
jgi:hypothetical protein